MSIHNCWVNKGMFSKSWIRIVQIPQIGPNWDPQKSLGKYYTMWVCMPSMWGKGYVEMNKQFIFDGIQAIIWNLPSLLNLNPNTNRTWNSELCYFFPEILRIPHYNLRFATPDDYLFWVSQSLLFSDRYSCHLT